ncbi:MAG: branched-chain amino acid aminotransferase [Pseudonocardia sediminis]
MSAVPFDDRDGVIWLDGRLVEWRSATLHVLSHGLHYASSVFEGERVYDGEVFALSAHSRRLVASARELGFTLPWTAGELDAATREVVAASGITDGYVRPIAWRGTESIEIAGTGTTVHVAVAAWEWPDVFDPGARERGIRLGTSRWRRPAPDTAPVHAKAAGVYALGTMARHEVDARGFDDALMLDHAGRVAEATGANVFLVRDGELHTPIADCFLPGITRATVLGLARERGMTVHERRILPGELADADEVFLTGTAYEVQPVRAVDGYEFAVGPVTRTLMADYAAATRPAAVVRP